MLVVGLTGSIGMGKSTAAKRFRDQGIPVFDADAVVHALYEGRAAPLIEDAFPGTVAQGKVDRRLLAQALMGDKARIKELEKIVHPLVREERETWLERQKRDGAAMVVLEVPLLFETGGDKSVDVTVLVTAPPEIQRARVLERPGMTPEKFESLLANQMSDEEKRKRADYIVDTNQPIEKTAQEIDKLIESLKQGRDKS